MVKLDCVLRWIIEFGVLGLGGLNRVCMLCFYLGVYKHVCWV